MVTLKELFCYKFTPEWLLYFTIEIALIAFFIVSIYNIVRLNEPHVDDPQLKYGLNIAIECVVIIIGIFLGGIWWKNKITNLQLCFCGHLSPFLIITGIAAIVATSKHLNKQTNSG